MNNNIFSFSPIGYLHCSEKYKAEQPRQGVFANNIGTIKLEKHCNYEQALQDLMGVQRLWLIFIFHCNKNWKPLVQPPINRSGEKIGVFATRSPHRPNNIGISCVDVIEVNQKKLTVSISNFDLLNETPILDIKPYIAAADSFPDSKVAWLEKSTNSIPYNVKISDDIFTMKADFIREIANLDLYNFCLTQLSSDPLNHRRKRLQTIDKSSNIYSIGCRTWQIIFAVDDNAKNIYLNDIRSNYSHEELTPQAIQNEDKYHEKSFHVAFHKKFVR